MGSKLHRCNEGEGNGYCSRGKGCCRRRFTATATAQKQHNSQEVEIVGHFQSMSLCVNWIKNEAAGNSIPKHIIGTPDGRAILIFDHQYREEGGTGGVRGTIIWSEHMS
jgi:hypothetical protein